MITPKIFLNKNNISNNNNPLKTKKPHNNKNQPLTSTQRPTNPTHHKHSTNYSTKNHNLSQSSKLDPFHQNISLKYLLIPLLKRCWWRPISKEFLDFLIFILNIMFILKLIKLILWVPKEFLKPHILPLLYRLIQITFRKTRHIIWERLKDLLWAISWISSALDLALQ